MKKVMVFGSFDVLHDGHRYLFSQARKLGDFLTVVVARDQTYERIRLYKPVHDEKARLQSVSAEDDVDKAILGELNDYYRVIMNERPDVIAIGYDQDRFIDQLPDKLQSFKLKTSIVKIDAYKSDTMKSSLLKG